MRFPFALVFLVFLLALTAAAQAAENATPNAAGTGVENPVDALKQSLRKDDGARTAHRTAPAVPTWMSLPRARREEILQEWRALPETTRPPFPIFRDAALDETVHRAETPRTVMKKEKEAAE